MTSPQGSCAEGSQKFKYEDWFGMKTYYCGKKFHCVKYARIRISENPYSRIFYAVFRKWIVARFRY